MKNQKPNEAFYSLVDGKNVSEMFTLIHDEFVHGMSIEKGMFRDDHRKGLLHLKTVANIIKPLNEMSKDSKTVVLAECMERLTDEIKMSGGLSATIRGIHDDYVHNIELDLFDEESQEALHLIAGVSNYIQQIENEIFHPENEKIRMLESALEESKKKIERLEKQLFVAN